MSEQQQQLTREQWDTISAALRAPFDPADVDFRPQGKPQAGKSCQMVCYVDARAVMDRLDEAVGPGAWVFDYEPLVMDKEIRIAKATLTIHGVAKSDVGEASEFAPSKGCVSDALKRCAALWGVGRYLYDVPSAWVTPDANGKIPPQEIAKLRAKLPRPGGASAKREEREDTAPIVQAQQQRQPTPIRQPQTPQPTTQPEPKAATPVADLAGKVVPPEEQKRLVTAIFHAICAEGEDVAATIDRWLDAHVRPANAPKGPIDAFQMKVGTSSLTIGEAKMITECVDALARLKAVALAEPHNFSETMWENCVRRLAGDVGKIRAHLEQGAARAKTHTTAAAR